MQTTLTRTCVPSPLRKQQVCKAEEMALDIPSITPELDRLIRQRGRDLRLRQVDKQQAAKLVNKLKTDLLKFLKDNQEQPFFRDVTPITTGSYFELVKIIKPNEFDIMLKLQTSSRLKWKALEKYNGAFYTVSLQRPARNEIRHFLLEDERTISSTKIMKEMHNLVQRFIKSYQVPAGEGRWVVHRRQINSPAVTLGLVNEDDGTEIMSVDIVPALEVPQGWPEAARAGPDVDKWLGKNTRRKFVAQPVYFVPKRPKQRNLSDVEKESWRISFSHIEKEMIRFHGNRRTCCERNEIRCCRKECLRLLKCLFEGLKERYKLEHLCSYHGKTAFFHNLSVRCEDSLWTPGQLSHCFMRLLCDFENSANQALLPHFFVRDYNLFSPSVFPKRSLVVLTSALKEQREEGFPLLQVRRPPAIGYNPAPPAQPQEVPAEPHTVTSKNDTVTSQHSSFTFAYVTVACIMLFMAVGCALYVKI